MIEPMGVVKLNSREGFRFDVSTTVHLRDMFLAGLSYRWKEGFSLFTGIRLDNLSLRYQFEIPVTSDIPNRFPSHTIQMAISLGQPLD
jgi:hypothetical protein